MKENKGIYESLVLIMQFGINMIVPILICTWFGVWLSERTGHKFLVVLLFLAGAIAGMQNCYKITKRMIQREKQRKGSREIASEAAAQARKNQTAHAETKNSGIMQKESGSKTGKE